MRVMLLLLFLGAAPGGQQEIGWLKLDQAKAISTNTGKVILVYVSCDPGTGKAPCSGGTGERSFSEPAILKRKDDFHYVRVCEKKTAQAVRATKPPEVIFLDPEGDEVYRSGFTDGSSLERAMIAAVQKYAPREIHWAGELPASPGGKPLLIVGFDDEKGESLKAFEDRTLVKYHDRIEFVRYSIKKDPEAVKKWGVGQAATIFICDAAKESPEKNALEKLPGKRSPALLKTAIQKALAKIEPKK